MGGKTSKKKEQSSDTKTQAENASAVQDPFKGKESSQAASCEMLKSEPVTQRRIDSTDKEMPGEIGAPTDIESTELQLDVEEMVAKNTSKTPPSKTQPAGEDNLPQIPAGVVVEESYNFLLNSNQPMLNILHTSSKSQPGRKEERHSDMIERIPSSKSEQHKDNNSQFGEIEPKSEQHKHNNSRSGKFEKMVSPMITPRKINSEKVDTEVLDQEVLNNLKTIYQKILWDEVESDDEGEKATVVTLTSMVSNPELEDHGNNNASPRTLLFSDDFDSSHDILLGDECQAALEHGNDEKTEWTQQESWDVDGQGMDSPVDAKPIGSPLSVEPIDDIGSLDVCPSPNPDESQDEEENLLTLDGLCDSEAQMRKLEAMDQLMTMDLKRQHSITFEIFRKTYHGIEEVSDADAKAVFERIDTDNNGVIDAEEWAAWMKFKTQRLMSAEQDVMLEDIA